MQYHVVMTERCNLHCSYCGGTRHMEGVPLDHTYTIDELQHFISYDPEPVIGFYGGEPLLALDYMYQILDNVPAKAYTLQTNATHLNEIDDKHLHKLHSILVSIDGDKDVTDRCRGTGTYDQVIQNLRDIENRGYRGDIIARMAYSDKGDIYRDVTHLLTLENPHFHHVHWQLDVFWSDLESRGDLDSWLKRYETGISRLVHDFGEAMKEGKVLGIIPFIPILKSLVNLEPTPKIRCGSGIDSFTIMTSGNIDVCPIAPDLPYSKVGDIWNSNPETLTGIMPVGSPCTECDVQWVCGGRCLFANRTMFWGRDMFDRVCQTTRHMINELKRLVPTVRTLIDEGVLSDDAFDYPEINNGCEIIP